MFKLTAIPRPTEDYSVSRIAILVKIKQRFEDNGVKILEFKPKEGIYILETFPSEFQSQFIKMGWQIEELDCV